MNILMSGINNHLIINSLNHGLVKKIILFITTLIFLLSPAQVLAGQGEVLGIHILHPYEFEQVNELLTDHNQDNWRYVTIPLSLNDLEKHDQWQKFFDECQQAKFIPLVRLASKPEGAVWKIPNRHELVSLISFLSALNWPTDQKYIMVLNEVNHAQEFGGKIEPAEYVEILEFTSLWAHSENKNYQVLPAAMDLAANNSVETREAFAYLQAMQVANPNWLELIDYWNSHSYPNPGFSAAPQKNGQNSLRGFEHELAWVKQNSGRDLQVFITETGWTDNWNTAAWLDSYYEYALQHIWSDERIMAVTPFLLQGSPGPFSSFSFLDESGQPTRQYLAFKKLIDNY